MHHQLVVLRVNTAPLTRRRRYLERVCHERVEYYLVGDERGHGGSQAASSW